MKKRSLLALITALLLCAAQTSQAQFIHALPKWIGQFGGTSSGSMVQKIHCVAATSCTLTNPVVPGDMLVVIESLPSVTSATLSDEQGDIFNGIYTTGWYGARDPGPMWYATGVYGGNVTVQSTTKAKDIFLAEYPPAAIDSVSQQTFLCCTPSASVGPITTTNPNELLITWVIFPSKSTIPASPGFTMEDTGTTIAVEDAQVAPGIYSATVPQRSAWGARMVSFKLLGPEFSKYKAPYGPIQFKTCARGGNGFVLPCQFDEPVGQGNTLVVVAVRGCIYDSNGVHCNAVSDSESNSWRTALVVPNDNGIPLWYALDAKGGTDTVYFAADTGQSAIIAEYPASLGLEDANYGTYKDPIFHQSAGVHTYLDVTRAIQTRGPCDLLIAWGISGTTQADAGPGVNFKMRTYYDDANLALEDTTSGVPGAYIGSMSWNAYAHWDIGVAAFNMGGCK